MTYDEFRKPKTDEWQRQKALNKEFFGYESFEGIICSLGIKTCKSNIEKWEKVKHPTSFLEAMLKSERKQLAEFEARLAEPWVK